MRIRLTPETPAACFDYQRKMPFLRHVVKLVVWSFISDSSAQMREQVAELWTGDKSTH